MFENLSAAAATDSVMLIQILTAGAAIVAAFAACISPLISLLVTKKHIESAAVTARGQILSASKIAERQIWGATVMVARREWNDRLRELVSELLTKLALLSTIVKTGQATGDQVRNVLEGFTRCEEEVILMVHPDDPLQRELEKAVEKIWHGVQNLNDAWIDDDEDRMEEAFKNIGSTSGEVVIVTRKVLDANWEKLKQEAFVTPHTED